VKVFLRVTDMRQFDEASLVLLTLPEILFVKSKIKVNHHVDNVSDEKVYCRIVKSLIEEKKSKYL